MFKKTFILFVFVLGLGGSVYAATELPRKAPDFPKRSIWLNAPNNSNLKHLKGSVTVVDFWDYTSINSIRNYSYLKQFQDVYGPLGLQVIGVHSPDFEFAYKKENLKNAVDRLGIKYPVLMDNQFQVWDEYEVFSWPTQFIINHEGKIVYRQTGEGNYREVEEMIRRQLSMAEPTLRLPPLVVPKGEQKLFDVTYCGPMSEEVRIGTGSPLGLGGSYFANEEGFRKGQVVDYVDRGKRLPRGFFAHGSWKNHADHFEHGREMTALEDYIGVNFQASEVYGVLSSNQWEPVRFYLLLNSEPLLWSQWGKDVKADADGNTYVLVSEPRLYYLLKDVPDGPQELKIYTKDEGASIHAVSFGNRCLTQFERL